MQLRVNREDLLSVHVALWKTNSSLLAPEKFRFSAVSPLSCRVLVESRNPSSSFPHWSDQFRSYCDWFVCNVCSRTFNCPFIYCQLLRSWSSREKRDKSQHKLEKAQVALNEDVHIKMTEVVVEGHVVSCEELLARVVAKNDELIKLVQASDESQPPRRSSNLRWMN